MPLVTPEASPTPPPIVIARESPGGTEARGGAARGAGAATGAKAGVPLTRLSKHFCWEKYLGASVACVVTREGRVRVAGN